MASQKVSTAVGLIGNNAAFTNTANVLAAYDTNPNDAVVEWNQFALAATVTAGQGPVPTLRSMSIVQVAVHDAVAPAVNQKVQEGAEEIDFMPNVGFLLSGMEREYATDIQGVVRAAGKVPVKIMLELPLLNLEQKQRAVAISAEAGVTYMKNSSGGSMGVATPEQMEFLRRIAPPHIRLKASGGIKTVQQVREQ